jgi:hypothetical protein
MYQQRSLVQVRARIPSEAVSTSSKRVLHFILTAKPEAGDWVKDGQYNDYPVPANLGKSQEVEYATGVYLRPGNYTLALIAFESDSNRISVFHREVHVEKIKNDPFPEIETYVPEIEFSVGFPQLEVGGDTVSNGELFPIAHQADWIPIATKQPVLVDVVLNITKRVSPPPLERSPMDRRYRKMMGIPDPPTEVPYQYDVGRVLQMGNVLAHLKLSSGCVRVSAIDVLRMKTIVDRADEQKLDWDKFGDQITKFDQNTVDAGVLANKRGPAHYARSYLQGLAEDSKGCAAAARHYVIVVSHELVLPAGARQEQLTAADAERATFYYFHSSGFASGDDLAEILKPAKPRRLGFGTPGEFRKSFGRLVQEMRAEQ